MYKIIIDSQSEFKLRIFTSEKRRLFILFTHINVPPVIIWFDVVHDVNVPISQCANVAIILAVLFLMLL